MVEISWLHNLRRRHKTLQTAPAIAVATTFFNEYALIFVMVLEVLILLSCTWSISIRTFVEYEKMQRDQAPLAIVIPERGKAEIVKLDSEDRSFRFQNLRFVLTKDKTSYETQPALDNLLLSSYLETKGHASRNSLTKAARTFGTNELNIPTPEFSELFKEQVAAPFFVFQVFTVGLWCMDEYWQFSVLTLFMLVLFEVTVTKRRIANLSVLRDMRSEPYDVYVYRCNRWQSVSSHDLVPGDVVSVVSKMDKERECPCDVVIVRGSCIVNEALLTGESVPLVKEALVLETSNSKHENLNLGNSSSHKRSILFAGTKILQHECSKRKRGRVPVAPDGGAVGVVIRTSWYTTQGDLMRTILYSTERVTANSGEAFLFIACLLVFAVIAASYVYTEGLKDERRDHWKLVLHCIMILTSVVPPELPMELSLAVNNSLIALRKVQIFCTEPFRIPSAGKVDVCCFDKTGTLTSDDMVTCGVDVGDGKLTSLSEVPYDAAFVMGACHSLIRLGTQISGDPMERVTLNDMGWSYNSSTNQAFTTSTHGATRAKSFKLSILRRFQFSSSLKRMSTIASLDHDAEKTKWVLTKGAPEVLRALMKRKPENYDDLCRYYAVRGHRVIALAYRVLNDSNLDINRDEVECDLNFAGLLVFHCPIKEDSRKIVRHLRKASHRNIMITGDAALTACHVARSVGIVRKKMSFRVLTLSDDGKIVWRQVSNDSEISFQYDEHNDEEDMAYCVNGDALKVLCKREKDQDVVIRDLCRYVSVWSRTSPEQKADILRALRDCGHVTLMCGDGTNDVGALKQAHVGVALLNPDKSTTTKTRSGGDLPDSVEEPSVVKFGDASIAAPFTSKISSVRSVMSILSQGRCTLVTTLQMYKILAVNCLVTAHTMSALFLYGIKSGDTQMTIMGLFTAAFFLVISNSKPVRKLSQQRPPTSVFDLKIILSIILQSALHLTCLYFAVNVTEPFVDFEREEMQPDADFKPNVINTVIYLLTMSMQTSSFVTNYRGRPFMESLRENKYLFRMVIVSYAIVLVCLTDAFEPLNDLFELSPFPSEDHRMKIFSVVVFDAVFSYLIDFTCNFVL